MTRAELTALVGAMSKGPWEALGGPRCSSRICRPDFATIAKVWGPGGDDESNAAGIAALRNHAAQLLAVCDAAEALLTDMERGGMYGPLMDALRAALRDLEGA